MLTKRVFRLVKIIYFSVKQSNEKRGENKKRISPSGLRKDINFIAQGYTLCYYIWNKRITYKSYNPHTSQAHL